MILRNVSGKEIKQMCCGKTYIWGVGEAMTLPDTIGAWMLAKLNSVEGGAQRDPETKAIIPQVQPEKAPPGKKEQVPDPNVVRAEIKAPEKPKDPEKPQDPKK